MSLNYAVLRGLLALLSVGPRDGTSTCPCSKASGLQLVRVSDPSPMRDGEPGSANLGIQLSAHFVSSADTGHSRTARRLAVCCSRCSRPSSLELGAPCPNTASLAIHG